MPNRFGIGCGCCNCLLFSDDFESASINPADWTELSGSWSVSCTATCQVSGSLSYAVLRTNKSASGNMGVRVDLTGATKGRLLIHVEDEDNYIAAEFDTASTTLKIIERSGGTDTTCQTLTSVSTIQQVWEFSSNSTCYSARSDDGVWFLNCEHGGIPSAGIYAGLGTGNGAGNSVSAEDFTMYNPDGSDADCPETQCGCNGCYANGESVASTLTVDLTGLGCSPMSLGSYGLTQVDDCKWLFETTPVMDKVDRIEVDASSYTCVLKIDYQWSGGLPGMQDFQDILYKFSPITDCAAVNDTFTGSGTCFTSVTPTSP